MHYRSTVFVKTFGCYFQKSTFRFLGDTMNDFQVILRHDRIWEALRDLDSYFFTLYTRNSASPTF